jgi:hypothetical protein
MNSLLLLIHMLIRLGSVLLALVVIGWIRHNDAKRERRRLQALGDLHEDDG